MRRYHPALTGAARCGTRCSHFSRVPSSTVLFLRLLIPSPTAPDTLTPDKTFPEGRPLSRAVWSVNNLRPLEGYSVEVLTSFRVELQPTSLIFARRCPAHLDVRGRAKMGQAPRFVTVKRKQHPNAKAYGTMIFTCPALVFTPPRGTATGPPLLDSLPSAHVKKVHSWRRFRDFLAGNLQSFQAQGLLL